MEHAAPASGLARQPGPGAAARQGERGGAGRAGQQRDALLRRAARAAATPRSASASAAGRVPPSAGRRTRPTPTRIWNACASGITSPAQPTDARGTAGARPASRSSARRSAELRAHAGPPSQEAGEPHGDQGARLLRAQPGGRSHRPAEQQVALVGARLRLGQLVAGEVALAGRDPVDRSRRREGRRGARGARPPPAPARPPPPPPRARRTRSPRSRRGPAGRRSRGRARSGRPGGPRPPPPAPRPAAAGRPARRAAARSGPVTRRARGRAQQEGAARAAAQAVQRRGPEHADARAPRSRSAVGQPGRRRRATASGRSPSTTTRTRCPKGGSACSRRRSSSPARNSSTAWRAPELHGPGRRLVGLHDHPGRLAPAPGAPGELDDEREGALLGAEARVLERGVGVEPPATVTSGRSWPLATIWVPSRIAAPGRANSASRRGTRAARPRRSSRPCARAGRRRHQARRAPPRAPGCRCPGAATSAALAARAHAGHRRLVAAVVAGQAPRGVVVDEGDVAVRAAGDPAARPAEGHQREAAAAGRSTMAFSPRPAAACRAAASGRETGPGALGAHVHDLDPAAAASRRRARQGDAAAARARSRGAAWRCRRPRPPRPRRARRAATWRAS